MKISPTMRIFAAVGPLAAGKTSLTINTVTRLIKDGHISADQCAYILNDEGAEVDGAVIADRISVLPMTNGCFTCSDESDLLSLLHELNKEGCKHVFLEGFGLVSGTETKTFLEKSGFIFDIVCVIDFKHFERNAKRYGEVMESQIKAATLGIAVTKYPEGWEDSSNWDDTDGGIMQSIINASHDAPLFFVPQGEGIPDRLLEKKWKKVSFTLRCKSGGGCCGCTHSHHHDHHAGHDLPHMYSYPIKEGTLLEELKEAFVASGLEFLRIKGACEGKMFTGDDDGWEQSLPDSRHYVTFYISRSISVADDIPLLAPLLVPEEESYTLLRKEHVSRSETVEQIEEILASLPKEPVIVHGSHNLRIITHPESLQLVKELSRRPHVKAEWFPIVLRRLMAYWIKCGLFLKQHEDEIDLNELGTNKRELGISLSWWATHQKEAFPEETHREVNALRPGEMAAEGVLMLKKRNSDPTRAYWQQKEIECALQFGLDHSENTSLLREAAEHYARMAP